MLALVLHALAVIVWNVGTRPPHTLFADMARAGSDRGALVRGAGVFVFGLLVIALAIALVRPLFRSVDSFAPFEAGAVVVALAVELLVGNDVRRALAIAIRPG